MQIQLKELIARKDHIQKEIQGLTKSIQLIDETKSFNSGLVDAEGFPRADIDFGELSNYRNLKRRKAQLNNDHFALMKQIQSKLFTLHASYPKLQENITETFQSKQSQTNFKKQPLKADKIKNKQQIKIDYLTPFLKVAQVSQHSPAEKAGLRVGDLVSQFQDINIYSLDGLKQIAGIVREGVPLKVIILRKTGQNEKSQQFAKFTLKDGNDYLKMQIKLVPTRWEGKGLLGCKIDPLTS